MVSISISAIILIIVLCFFAGLSCGLLVMSLCFVAGRADDWAERGIK